jgi:hypothetical protein
MSDIIPNPKNYQENPMPVITTAKERITHNDTTRTLREWCQLLNLNYLTVRMRYIRGERDTDKLFKATPAPKKGPPNSAFPRARVLRDNTPPLWVQELQYDIRTALLEMSGYNRETLEVLLKKIATEYVEREIMKLPKYQ